MSLYTHTHTHLLFLLSHKLHLTLCDSMDCSLTDSSVHGFSRQEILEWVAISFSNTHTHLKVYIYMKVFPGGSAVMNLFANAGDEGDMDLIPVSGRSPGGGNDNPLKYSCLENSLVEDTGGLQSMGPQRVRQDRATELIAHTHTHTHTHTRGA